MSFRLFIFLLVWLCCALNASAGEVKNPNVAGAFYPAEASKLSADIDRFLDNARPDYPQGQIFALVSPHAGYAYSGQVAAFGYKLINKRPYKTVVLIAPSHRFGFEGISIFSDGAFRTPLGDIPVDKDFAQGLLSKKIEGVAFLPEAFKEEHSLEVQLPFLQKALSDFKIVPIITGNCSWDACRNIALFLKEAIAGRKDVLVIASTDLYHGFDYEEAASADSLTISSIARMDAEGLYKGLREGKMQLCGGFGVVITLLLSKELGYDKAMVLNSTNSAVVTGNKRKGTWTVGYASVAISEGKEEAVMMLNKQQRERLLEIARKSIESYLKDRKKLMLSEQDQLLLKEMGAFVTLHKNKELRGCIGNIIGRQPLYLTVRDMAIEAATGDPRFPQVGLPELKDIEIEISVLSPLEKVDSVDKIKLGVHGVLVRKGFNSGVFLPQVATETGWSKEEFLSYLCSHKAGLDPLAWKDKSTEIYTFTAEVFSEQEH